MARENKRNRMINRIGTGKGMLIDSLIEEPWTYPYYWDKPLREKGFRLYDEFYKDIHKLLCKCHVFNITNVFSFAFDVDVNGVNFKKNDGYWIYTEDFPGFIPPFEYCFFEYDESSRIAGGARHGLLCIDACAKEENKDSDHDKNSDKKLVMFLFAKDPGNPPTAPIFTSEIHYNSSSGKISSLNSGIFDENCFAVKLRSKVRQDFIKDYEYMHWASIPVALSISFCNCKNVSISEEKQTFQYDRERRRAGLLPFFRYHTINIEPMKHVLRTEGGVETNGLKKALHICRGHFATYTEERPLFGRTAGTFWVPSHVRGSAKHGVVVSDYNVNAPKTTD